ncbi:MAG: DUF6364 family protein [Bacteroidia bacterium]|jgi:hypothetical protein
MDTKLTLTIEETVIAKAKKYAKKSERSLSDIIENYLIALTQEKEVGDLESTTIVKSLKGTFSNNSNLNYKDQLKNELTKKYL